MSGERVSNT